MKRKTRTITINNKKYVWWHGIGVSRTVLKLSPENDKTSTVEIIFEDNSSEEFNHPVFLFEFISGIITEKDGVERCVKILEPAMAGLVLPYLQEQGTFMTRKHITLNGFELLSKLGYEVTEIEKNYYW